MSSIMAAKHRLECLDVVDEQNRIVGWADRPLIHQLGLRHRAVHVFVFNGQGEVFVQQRSLLKKTDPGLWDSSVSGHVDTGETCYQAAIREMAEEVGVRADIRLCFVLPAEAATGFEFSYLYLCQDDGPMVLQPEEVSDGCWLTPAALSQELTQTPQCYSSSLRLLWKKWLSQLE